MRLRLVDGVLGECVGMWDDARERWLPLVDAVAHGAAQVVERDVRRRLHAACYDAVEFLSGGAAMRDAACRVAESVADERFRVGLAARMPFGALSLRPFLLSSEHCEGVARGLAARYASSWSRGRLSERERTARPEHPGCPPRPPAPRAPLLYQGNHNTLLPSGSSIAVPPYGHDLDFELGFVVCRDVRDASPAECRDAIGALVVLNDVTLRDTQWREMRDDPFGPVQKCKSFATTMSSELLTSDEVLTDLPALSGTVEVDGERWASGRADDFSHSLEHCLARACAGETIRAGELLSTGSLAGCSGIEAGRLPPPGAQVTLTVPHIGVLTNRFGGDVA